MSSLQIFLKNEPLEQITISRAMHKLWSDHGVRTEEVDSGCLIEILKEIKMEINESERKNHLELMQNENKVLYGLNLHFINLYIDMMNIFE